jgi:3',5'-cyclic AMP phosphodiesterase CpdA
LLLVATAAAFAAAAPPLDSLFDGKGSHPDVRVSDSLLEASKGFRVEAQLAKLDAQPAAADGSVRFAVIGDMEPGRFVWERRLWGRPGAAETQLRSIQTAGVEFAVQLGDFVSRGTSKNYARFFGLMRRVDPKTPYLPVLGNHDRSDPHTNADAALFEKLLAPANYAFDRGGFRFVLFDTTGEGVTPEQLRWLDAALDTDRKKLVFVHIPPVQLKRFLTLGLGGFIEGSEEFTAMMTRRHVARVYCGHIHGLAWTDYGGVRYVLSGGGGSPLYPSPVERVYHYITVDAGEAGVRETVHTLEGREFDLPEPAGPDLADSR